MIYLFFVYCDRGHRDLHVLTHSFPTRRSADLEAFLKAGAAVEIVSLAKKPIKGWRKKNWGDEIEVDLDLNAASPSRYDGLMLPGGTLNADTLRTEPRAITFIKDLLHNDKPVAAIDRTSVE